MEQQTEYGFKAIKQNIVVNNKNNTQYSIIPSKEKIKVFAPAVYTFEDSHPYPRLRNIIYYFTNRNDGFVFYNSLKNYLSLKDISVYSCSGRLKFENENFRITLNLIVNEISDEYSVEINITQ